MFTIDKIICSAGEPASKNVLWMDISTVPSTLKFFSVRGWEPISGGILKYKEATSTEDRVDILPNIPYIINGNNLPESFDITLLGDTSQEYFIEIVAPEAIDVTWPEIITWQNDTAPIIEGGKVYHISIVNTYGVYTEFTYTAPVPPTPLSNYVEFSKSTESICTISIENIDQPIPLNLEVSTDLNEDWTSYSIGTEVSFSRFARFRGIGNTTFSPDVTAYNYFSISGDDPVSVSGTLASLLDYATMPNTISDYCFIALFNNITCLTDASGLVFPSSTGWSSYQYMFQECNSLVASPLTLPATILAPYCYSGMFTGCTSLTSAPALPATILAEGCYSYMFESCSNLSSFGELPALELVSKCYEFMFSSCSSLSEIGPVAATSWNTDYTSNWLDSVADEGHITVTADDIPLDSPDGVPSGWVKN